ncbi:GNAT family N-acetyltransferase [Promethearchaeum syntrophicum]|uniref:GNAT family N-acetyltransferase n=1 Tax=Promethearchaeum syntrophicum TaxID=2594042 RepID=A0A5B9DEY7_9ARCH|nr:GNAT family protein [Candidatus Prometheoarchaeum syntrophicum]QEE17694.1 putative acetyltransferase YhhY [Candidatus Prometheoarchaeum syntrophicum]
MNIKSTFSKKKILNGENIDLIKSIVDHSPSLYQQIKSPGVLENLTIDIEDQFEFKKYLIYIENQWNLNHDFTFTICKKGVKNNPKQTFIGQVSIYGMNFLHSRAEVGIWVGRAHWNNGYAKQALEMIISHAFLDIHLNRLQAHIFTQNDSSIRVFEKLGFKREGLNELYVKKTNGDFNDVYVYALLFQNWGKNQLKI